MMYAYPYTLCRRGVVATFDLSASNLDMFEADHRLSNEKNCLVLRLTQPAYNAKPPTAHVSEQPLMNKRDTMRSWSVGDLASFFAKRDMEGPAQRLREQGVAGEDFVDFTSEQLQQDLRFSAFAAHKLLRIRDAYLAEPRRDWSGEVGVNATRRGLGRTDERRPSFSAILLVRSSLSVLFFQPGWERDGQRQNETQVLLPSPSPRARLATLL